jgi:solute:Na+ symporter, SSS family
MDPYIYQYSIGGFIFLVGLFYAWKQGYVGTRGAGLRNFLVLTLGLAFFAGLQGYLEYGPKESVPSKPYTGGGPQPTQTMGTALDYGIMIGYFVIILVIGTWFGRKQQTTKDFFFGGQRFSWWLITFSLMATTVGSYSFVKYSKVAFGYGLASSQTYLNDWFWVPLFIFGWLPILYFSRITSIPEYFERRFNRRARRVVTWLLLVYLIGYVGVNLFTMGKALNILLGWDIPLAAMVVATISAIYVTSGGQTSVIMTDLFQGVMLLATGFLLLYLGAEYLGGFEELWENLPEDHRKAFANFNEDPSYNSVGIFWQDAVANTAMFYFLNQGLAMRFMATRSVGDARRAMIGVLLVLMPIAAIVVASGGWVGKSLSNAGVLDPEMEGAKAFFISAEFLSQPGVFGLVMAALTAALMSTVDTLLTAVAAIVVNDIYQPAHPEAEEKQLLKVARFTAVGVTILGLLLVPVMMMFDSIYAAHGAFTAAVTPPLVVALLFGVFWRRYTTQAAVWTVSGGGLAILASMFFPELVAPFSHGVPPAEIGDGLFEGFKQYKFTRALYGLSVSAFIGVAVTFLSRPEPFEKIKGLVWGTQSDAIKHYKGKEGTETESDWATVEVRCSAEEIPAEGFNNPGAKISAVLARELEASEGDLLYVTDARGWLGGLRSGHVTIVELREDFGNDRVELSPSSYSDIVAKGRDEARFKVKRLY